MLEERPIRFTPQKPIHRRAKVSGVPICRRCCNAPKKSPPLLRACNQQARPALNATLRTVTANTLDLGLAVYQKDTHMMMPLVFELITMLALGVVFGRLWEIRQQALRQMRMDATGFNVPTAHLPSL